MTKMVDYDNGIEGATYSIKVNNHSNINSYQYPIVLNNNNNNNNGLLMPMINDNNQQLHNNNNNNNNNNHFILTHQTQQQQQQQQHHQYESDHQQSSGSSYLHNANHNINHYHGVDIDTATIVSIASSCIILISGCIAVVCLIMYMKKTDMLYRTRTCAKCGAHVSSHTPGLSTTTTTTTAAAGNVIMTNNNQDVLHQSGTPISIRSENAVRSAERAEHLANVINYQNQLAKSQPNLSKEMDSTIVIYCATNQQQHQPQQQQQQQTSKQTDHQIFNQSTAAQINDYLTDALKNETKNNNFINIIDDNDDEAAPYATFNLPGFESVSKISDTYETFAAKFSEPPYMLLKKGIECPPQYADSIDCKLRMTLNTDNTTKATNDKHNDEQIYSSNAINHYHSITSCVSSNQDELIRAYEFGNEQKEKLLKLQDEVIKQLANSDNDDKESIYNRSIPMISDHESPTDPGIREFTKSPPKPNEKRQGIVFHHQPTVADILKMSKQFIDSSTTNAKTSLTNQNSGEASSNETSKSLSSLKASSIDDDDDDSTPSGGSDELGNDEQSSSSSSSSSSETIPENEQQQQQSSSSNNNKKYFGAISRNRSRNPSWANYTTMKSNQVLDLQPEQNFQQQATNVNKRAFVTNNEKEFSSIDIDEFDDDDDDVDDDDDEINVEKEFKKGLSSDDYDDMIIMMNNCINNNNNNNDDDGQIIQDSYVCDNKNLKTTRNLNNRSPISLLDSITMHIKQTYANGNNQNNNNLDDDDDIFTVTKSSYEDNLSLLLAAEAESINEQKKKHQQQQFNKEENYRSNYKNIPNIHNDDYHYKQFDIINNQQPTSTTSVSYSSSSSSSNNLSIVNNLQQQQPQQRLITIINDQKNDHHQIKIKSAIDC